MNVVQRVGFRHCFLQHTYKRTKVKWLLHRNKGNISVARPLRPYPFELSGHIFGGNFIFLELKKSNFTYWPVP